MFACVGGCVVVCCVLLKFCDSGFRLFYGGRGGGFLCFDFKFFLFVCFCFIFLCLLHIWWSEALGNGVLA